MWMGIFIVMSIWKTKHLLMHLLKNGFAQVDTKNKYAQFNKFSKIVQERDMVIKEQLKEHRIAF